MPYNMKPLGCDPARIKGMSERLIVSHYENNYGGAVRTLNAVRKELASLDAGAPAYRIRALKREELTAANSVALHELYFANLGGEGNKVPEQIGTVLEQEFGSVTAWRREFVGSARFPVSWLSPVRCGDSLLCCLALMLPNETIVSSPCQTNARDCRCGF